MIERIEGLPLVIDGHIDSLQSCEVEMRDFLEESEKGHVDLPRAKRGGLGGMFASIYLRPTQVETNALGYAMKYFDDLLRLVDRSAGDMELIRTADQLDSAVDRGTFAMIPHIEGAEAISRSLKELRVLYEAGLRSVGVVHARPNMFGQGVPIPRRPDMIHGVPASTHAWGLRNGRELPYPTAGLTDLGRELVYECQRLGIAVDASHLTPQGFWDVAKESTRPFLCTHSSVKAICDHPRNLDDDQLRAVADADAVVGINFFVCFLRPDKQRDPDTPIELILQHIDYVVQLIGDRHVAIGTDFDGANMPDSVRDASKMIDVVRGMRDQLGYSDDRLERICNGNWRRVLRAAWN